MMDPSVVTLLEKHRKYFKEQENGRIVCTLNNHSLPASRQALETFINGKKYAQLKKKADAAAALQKFEPFLLPSRNFPGQLYCALTCQVMQAKLETVKKHMNGKRFAAAKAEFETDNRELMEEPDVSDTASSGQDQDEAEQALDAELAIDVQDDGASLMEGDVLPEAACPGTLPAGDRADDAVNLASEATTKGGHKRKQQHSSTNKLPRTRGKPIKRKVRQSNGT
ncbi:hypothetical protein WJX77_002600 [Trebouxia sp. C0004]